MENKTVCSSTGHLNGKRKTPRRRACVECRRVHVCCSRDLPSCTRCIKRGTPCVYLQRKKRKKRSTANDQKQNSQNRTNAGGSKLSCPTFFGGGPLEANTLQARVNVVLSQVAQGAQMGVSEGDTSFLPVSGPQYGGGAVAHQRHQQHVSSSSSRTMWPGASASAEITSLSALYPGENEHWDFVASGLRTHKMSHRFRGPTTTTTAAEATRQYQSCSPELSSKDLGEFPNLPSGIAETSGGTFQGSSTEELLGWDDSDILWQSLPASPLSSSLPTSPLLATVNPANLSILGGLPKNNSNSRAAATGTTKERSEEVGSLLGGREEGQRDSFSDLVSGVVLERDQRQRLYLHGVREGQTPVGSAAIAEAPRGRKQPLEQRQSLSIVNGGTAAGMDIRPVHQEFQWERQDTATKALLISLLQRNIELVRQAEHLSASGDSLVQQLELSDIATGPRRTVPPAALISITHFSSHTIERKLIRANNEFRVVLGYSWDEMPKLSPDVLFSAREKERVQAHGDWALRNGVRSFRNRTRFLHKSGAEIELEHTIRTFYKADGTPDYFIVIFDNM